MSRSLFQTNSTIPLLYVEPYVEPDELEESTYRTMISPPVGDVHELTIRLRKSTRVIRRPYYLTYIAHGVAPDETPWSKHWLC